ncbi:MAG: hypothetical protein EXS25_05310 [Pedosphaera sp.]|nr:hypothetical protein [Pedosphaera sp.]
MNSTADNARRTLSAAAHRKDVARRVGVGLAAGSSVLLVLLTLALTDYWLIVPPWIRGLGLIVICGFLVGAVRFVARILGQSAGLKEVALDAEGRVSDLGCEVSTAAEYLSGQQTASAGYETLLAEALEARASLALERNQTPYTQRFLIPAFLGGGGVFVGFVVFLLFAPSSGKAFLRALVPWTSATFTEVKVSPQGGEFPVGSSLSISSKFSGRAPNLVVFQWRIKGSNLWTRVPITVLSNLTAVHHLEVALSGTYRVIAGDAVSPEYTLEAFIPAKVQTATIGLTPPTYTRIGPTEQAMGDITIIRGTRALFRMEGNVPLGSASLRFTNGAEILLSLAGSNFWTAQLTLTNDTAYEYALTDLKGRPGIDRSLFRIRALPDQPPKVDITEPGEDIRAEPTEKVPLTVKATDDFGIASLRIIYHKLDESNTTLEVRDRHVKDGETLAAAVLRLEGMKLRPFDVLAYYAEARDNNDFDGPGIGRSPTYFIEIANPTSPPASKRKGPPSQKLNLLAIQKGIVADTTSLPTNAAPPVFAELAQRQRDAREFAEMYRQKLEEAGAPFVAQGAIEAAVEEMGQAAKSLTRLSQGEALPREEKALAHLYEAIKAMPQLKNLPTRPMELGANKPEQTPEPAAKEPVSVVLEELKKKSEEIPNLKELKEALTEARELAKAQGEIASKIEGEGEGQGEGQGEGKGKPKNPAMEPSKESEVAKDSKQAKEAARLKEMASRAKPREPAGKEAGKEPNKGEGKEPGKGGEKGQGKELGEGTGKGGSQPGGGRLAAAEKQLGEKAKKLGEKVKQLVAKDSKPGQAAGKRLDEASRQVDAAAQALEEGNKDGAGASSASGAAGLSSAADLLERVISGKPLLSDVSAEEAPKKFEGQISEYFKRLTRAE